ncbi:imelysin family protein [Parashewanella tropica]|uniref:imelysin family protein n=1 Tax=Parashewanella tropica TaxID=2547970 RepID=UPI0010596070|nr:imelysin family protein [Parashewanella tropica]
MKKTIIAVSLVTLLAACGGSGKKDDTPTPTPDSGKFSYKAQDMIVNLTDDVIVAGYSNLAMKGSELFQLTETLQATPNAENWKKVQDAWKAARQPWEQGESHIFGPIEALEIDPHLDSWPLNTVDLKKQLDGNASFDAKTIKTWEDGVQGFHAMEYLLFGDGKDDNEKAFSEATPREIEYLKALAEVLRDYTSDLEKAWKDKFKDANGETPYAERLKNVSSSPTYSSQVGVIEELVQGMAGIAKEVGEAKIAEPFGGSIDNVDTSKVESQYSWNSLIDFANNIKGVKNVWEGEFAGSKDKPGIVDFVKAGDSALADKVTKQINDSITNIEKIAGNNNMPFRQAIKDVEGRKRVKTAVDSLAALKASLENDVVPLIKKWDAK